MKIKIEEKSYAEVLAMPVQEMKKPKKPNILFRTLLPILSLPDILFTRFSCKKIGMEKLGKKEPCLILMNHSSFIDLKIASTVLYPRPFNIVCTSDGFVGKNWLMRSLGCIPAKKFVTDLALIRDMNYAVKKLNCSVLMYPEASYSFDGTATPLPDSLGRYLKMLGIPVVMIRTFGAFARDPLYNNLQLRKVKVSAEMKYLLAAEDIEKKSADELNSILADEFSFDNFKWQQENNVRISEKFRADHLERVLYKCPHCMAEGKTGGKGIYLTCNNCGKKYELTEYGFLKAVDGESKFTHIPDWYRWERDCVREEIQAGKYNLCTEVDIYMLVNTKRLYRVGEGVLEHSNDGFHLTGCNGELDYSQKSIASYCLYSDYYWYEIGDMISIGNTKALYYCFPKNKDINVSKARLAAEELYKITKKSKI